MLRMLFNSNNRSLSDNRIWIFVKITKIFTGQQKEVTRELGNYRETEKKETAQAIVVADGSNKFYQYSLNNNNWTISMKLTQLNVEVYGIFEIDNVCYVVNEDGISTVNQIMTIFEPNYAVHKFPSNEGYDWCATCRVDSKILVICKDLFDDDVESKLFDPINLQWIDVDIKVKRKHFAVVEYLGAIWIVGGERRGKDGKFQNLNWIEVYDPVSKSKVLRSIKMIQARSGHKVIVYKKKLFVFGGRCEDGFPLNTVEMYSPETNKFVEMAPMKVARSDFACCRVGNLVYVVGGNIYGGGSTNSVEVYNIDTNTWTDGVDLPNKACHIHACVVNNKIH